MPKDELWRRFVRACRYGRLDWRDLLDQCREGEAQFHDLPNACAVTSIHVSGSNRVCYITVAAGTLEGMRELAKVITTFATEHGCDAIRTMSRPGFSRVYKALDDEFSPVLTVYEKQLTE